MYYGLVINQQNVALKEERKKEKEEEVSDEYELKDRVVVEETEGDSKKKKVNEWMGKLKRKKKNKEEKVSVELVLFTVGYWW